MPKYLQIKLAERSASSQKLHGEILVHAGRTSSPRHRQKAAPTEKFGAIEKSNALLGQLLDGADFSNTNRLRLGCKKEPRLKR